ncbi:MAG: hypothetical protein H6605_06085 [Flavobacteriales bacterium]|nr:hypothetical protein [Flavobacteriales bacterium]
MKKLILSLLCLIVLKANAQESKDFTEQGKTYAGAGAGVSITGLLVNADLETDSVNYIGNSSVAVYLNLDHFTLKKFSIGLQASYQKMSVYVNHWEFVTRNNTLERFEDVSVKMNRFYIGGRFLLHYKNTPKVDVYSGLRLGAIIVSKDFSNNDAAFKAEFENEFPIETRSSFGLVAIGSRIKFTPEISAMLELNFGAPYLFAFGGTYTFN